MKTNSLLFLTALTLTFAVASSRGELSAPDNIVYGTIAINSVAVTAANASIVVEARRSLNGAPIASYQMGSNSDAAAFYELRIPVEEQNPLDNLATSSLVTNSLFIVIRNSAADQGSQTYAIPERGNVQRLDFNINPTGALPDTDSDGLPDAWELAKFGNLNQTGSGDFDGDGVSNFKEYLAGTDPTLAVSRFQLIPSIVAGSNYVSFFAISTTGVPGYEGSTRHYSIESTPSLSTGTWSLVPGYSDIIGNNSTKTLPVPPTMPTFYRGKVWLTRP